MAKIRFTPEVLEDLIFSYASSPVRIVGPVGRDENGLIVLEISGANVPDAPEVIAICNVQQNRAWQRLVSMKFKAIGEAK
jgi:hypothetical protein